MPQTQKPYYGGKACLPPPLIGRIARHSLGLTFALALAASTIPAHAEGQIDFRATANAPVHLMRNSKGAAFTAVIDKHPVTGELRIKKHPVTPAEIAQLEAKGVTLAFLPDPDEPPETVKDGEIESLKQAWPAPAVPPSFTIMRLYGTPYGGFWTTGGHDQSATTHWSNFTVTSNGLSATVEHMAHSLIFDGAAASSQSPVLIGNGMLIGKSEGYSGAWHVGCGSINNPGYYGEVESFWHNNNALYPATCTPTGLLNDGQSNTFALHANVNQWVAYWVQRNGQNVYIPPAVNTAGQRPYWDPSKGGVLFIVTDTPQRPEYYHDYMLSFGNVSTGWF